MNSSRFATIVRLAFAASAFAFAVQHGKAAVRTWCGPSGEQEWSATTNWVDGAVPTGGDTAYFPQNSEPHPNNTGKRRYLFKVTPPSDFTGVILTTNEFAVADYTAANYNMNFRPYLELAVLDGATWTVAGCGEIAATAGIGGRLSQDFTGTVDVRAGTSFAAPSGLNQAVAFVGAGTLELSSASQAGQAAAFAGTVKISSEAGSSVASLIAMRNATVEMTDGSVLAVDSSTAAFNFVEKLDSFAESPAKWTFNGTASVDGNIPSGPFNKNPPYVRDGELWLTDEPAQVHTAWYADRRFRLTDSWGMKFTYFPELPTDTRVTQEPRADGNGRSQTICGYFGILLSRYSTDNCVPYSTSTSIMANDARGFVLYLYRDDGGARACWVSEGAASSYRAMNESFMNGIRLDRKIDFAVSMIGGTMTVTMSQDGKSVTFARDYSIIDSRAPEGYYVGFGGATSWWGDNYAVPWVRNRISNFSAWYSDPTESPGWENVQPASDFDISDSSKWNYKKVRRENDADTNLSDSQFTASGVKLLDAVPLNAAYMISKAKVGRWNTPIAYRFRCRTDNSVHTQDSDAYVTILFGDNNNSTQSNGAGWNSSGGYYYANFQSWTRGLDACWNVNKGTLTIERAKWGGDSTPANITTCTSSSSMGNTWIAATLAPAKNIRADFVYDGAGTLKSICEISLQDHTLSRTTDKRGNGMIGVLTWANMQNTAGFDAYTNKEQYVGIKAMARSNSYSDMMMTELSIRRMKAARCGTTGAVAVPADGSATLSAGELMPEQAADVLTISSLDLAAGSTLSIRPETSATIVGLERVASAGATVAAEAGTKIRLGESVVLTGEPSGPGLVLSGSVDAPDELTICIPSSWQRYRAGEVCLIDARGVTTGFALSPDNVTVRDENGVVSSKKVVLRVVDGLLTADFRHGFAIIIR